MPFSVQDLRDLLQLLDQHPDWKREVRRAVLAEDLLELPHIVRELAEAQKRTEERLAELEERLAELGQRVRELAEAQKQTQEHLAELDRRLLELEQRVLELAEAQKQTQEHLAELDRRLLELEQRVRELAEAQKRTEERLEKLIEAHHRLEQTVARLVGAEFERAFREKVRSIIRRPFRKARVLSRDQLADSLDEAVERGRIGEADADELLQSDAVVLASDPQGDVWIAVEVSRVVDRRDVERAVRRAQILQRVGHRALAGVVGERKTMGAEEPIAHHGVLWWPMRGED